MNYLYILFVCGGVCANFFMINQEKNRKYTQYMVQLVIVLHRGWKKKNTECVKKETGDKSGKKIYCSIDLTYQSY